MKNKIKKYNKRIWLNSKESPSTGSVTAFSGKVKWGSEDKQERIERFLEIADCICKVRLHQCYEDTDKMFIKKMKKLRNFIDDYINVIKNENTK
jgi:hypothetical protein